MVDTPLIYSDLLPAGHWVDFQAPLSPAIRADLTLRGWSAHQLNPGFRVFCPRQMTEATLHAHVVQLIDDERLRSAIPGNTLISSQMFKGALIGQ